MQEFIKDSDIFTVDALYVEPDLAAIHLLRAGDKLAIIDTGTQYSVSQVQTALDKLGLGFKNVELIILTHIHLDHAGGASALMHLCDCAQLIVHPKGARHMADPSKLIAGAKAVYGEEEFKSLYGEISAIDSSRIFAPEDQGEISLGNKTLVFLDSPGHANHHHCILDKHSNSVFTGDTLGIAYQTLRDPDHAFVMPTTTPVQFDPEALHNSINKIMDLQPEHLYYTHYSALKPSASNIAGLHEQIDDYVMMTQQAADQDIDNLESIISQELYAYSLRRAENELDTVSSETIKHWVKLDSTLNAQGLAFWWHHRRTA